MTAVLRRQRQFGGKIEGTEGTAETLVAADFRGNYKEIEYEPEAPGYDRERMRGSLSKDPELKAARSLTLRAVAEAVGAGVSTSLPWHDLAQACGFSKTQIKVVDVGAVSGGTFEVGDVIGDNAVQSSATKTGVFIRLIAGTPNRIVYMPVTGVFANTDTMYNYASPQVSAAVDSAPANAGWAFTLLSETASQTPASATVEVRDGDQVHRIIGGRGLLEFRIEWNKPMLMAFEFKGPMDTTDDEVEADGFLTGIAPVTAVPVMGKGFPFLLDDYSPIATQFTIRVDNTLALRPTIGDQQVAESGYMPTRISDRRVTASMDPERPVVATYSFLNRNIQGATFRPYIEVGFPGNTNGWFILTGPKAQLSGNVSPGDRDGIELHNVEMLFALGTTDDDEFVLYQVCV